EQIIRTKNVQWKKYRTRVVSVANQVNLNFKEAQPELVKALVKSISGII
ncbi:MAG TPA: complement resistance protein TraT, partial [Arcobacter sp.]|nr:complement resistance protein TraT [Arcobacter sp.]